MKDDQIVRIAAAVSLAGIYIGHVAFNGSGPVQTPTGRMSPFFLAVSGELILAFPELLDRLPFGPTRKQSGSQ